MRSRLVFQISSTSGIQLRIVQRLKAIGIITKDRAFKQNPSDGSRHLILTVMGSDASNDDIWNQVSEIPGVLKLVADEVNASMPTASAPSRTRNHESEKHVHVDEEGGDTEVRDRMLIFSLLSNYPKLSARFNVILSDIAPENRLKRSLELGRGFGSYLSKQVKPNGPMQSLQDVMTNLIIPALSPMASLRLDDDTIIISESHVDLVKQPHREESCQFIRGTIVGLLRSHDLRELFSDNKCCLNHGGSECSFIFNT